MSQVPEMEVEIKKKQRVKSVDGKLYVATSLAEKQDVKRAAKKQTVESKEGNPHVKTNQFLAEKQVEAAKKPHSRNKDEDKNREVAKPEDKNREVAKPEDKNEASSDFCGFKEWVMDPFTAEEEMGIKTYGLIYSDTEQDDDPGSF